MRRDSRDRQRRDSRDRTKEHRGRSRSNSRDRGRDRKRYRSRSNPRDNNEKEKKSTKENVDVVKVDIVAKVETPIVVIATTTVDEDFIFDEENYRRNYKDNALEQNIMNNNIVLALHSISNTALSAKVSNIISKINVYVDTIENDKINNETKDAPENVIDVNIENEMKEDEVTMKVDTSYASIDDSSANILDNIEMDKTEETNDIGGDDDDGFDLYGDLGMSENVEETVESEPAEEDTKAMEEEGEEIKAKEGTNDDVLDKKASLLTADIVSIPLYLQDMSYNRLCQVTKMNNQKGFSTTMSSSIDGLKKLLHC